jgi:hypothetical protein
VSQSTTPKESWTDGKRRSERDEVLTIQSGGGQALFHSF